MFCVVDVQPLGPVHAYEALVTAPVFIVKASPAHGAFTVTVGVAGIAFITTVVVDVAVHPFIVTVKVYVPLAAVVGLAIIGFCEDELKPFGPVHP